MTRSVAPPAGRKAQDTEGSPCRGFAVVSVLALFVICFASTYEIVADVSEPENCFPVHAGDIEKPGRDSPAFTEDNAPEQLRFIF